MNAIEKINQRHIIILYRLVLGEPQKKIAEDIGMSERHVSRVVNSPVFQDELKKLSDDLREKVINNSEEVRQIFNAASPDAARKLVELMHTAPEPKDQIKAADKIIEYSDYNADKVEVVKEITYTEEQIALFKEGFRDYKSDKELEKEKEEEGKDIYEIERDFSDLN